MLELKNIKKDYPAGDGVVHALKGIDLQFRKSEFVSILGPSGCGKTTMLNIIGGLDHYTDGDLIIDGVSTKHFKDRDWDSYRNHSIGFVFQSYNLIPHQSVLQNVELALTLTGVSKKERRERAKKALEQVGLGSQLKKRPSEMSGGQMQRVAIARALVNNPEIILADEPTGALDTETSVQVMDILKEISKDKLIIMVTHNPELAEKYSTRIIRVLDGEILSDSNPLTKEEVQLGRAEEKAAKENRRKEKKPTMRFSTAFSLSLRNLFTKRGRTALTSFAGSIGIIGIALIYAVSQGFSMYIDAIQEETLSSYPLTIQSTNVDVSTLMETFMGSVSAESDHPKDAIYTKGVVYDIMDGLSNIETTDNDLKSFKTYIETERANEESTLHSSVTGVQYTYDTDLIVYTKNVDGDIIASDTRALLQDLVVEYMGMDMRSMENMSGMMENGTMSSMMTANSGMNLWQEMLPGDDGKLVNDVLEKQYDIVYGSWPTEYNEIVLVVDENNELDDMTLYALGLESKENIDAIMNAAMNKTAVEPSTATWSYEEICDMEFRTILSADCYTYDENTGHYTDLRETEAGLKYLYDNGLALKVSGIIRPNEKTTAPMLTGSIGYTSELTKYIIEASKDSSAIEAQLADPEHDIFTGLPFSESTGTMTDTEKETIFRHYIEEMDSDEKAEAYIQIMSIPSQEQLDAAVAQAMDGMTREDMDETMTQAMTAQLGMSENDISGYISEMSDEDMEEIFTQLVAEQVKAQYAAQVGEQMAVMDPLQLTMALNAAMPEYTTEECALYYDNIMEFSESSYDINLKTLGYVDLDDPATINLYAATFEDKDLIEEAITAYNTTVDDISQIRYTDYVGLMMSSITTIINAITYVLIAFVAISLIVSSIMIGVITLISVQERTKEIGILRAMGASKRNVSSMFNAETVIIGFSSGLLGVLITYLLCIPINAILHDLTGLMNLSATLPIPVAVVLVVISMALTLFSGIIPSRSAAKKDPVEALRSE